MIQRIRHQCLSRIKSVGSNPIPSTFLTKVNYRTHKKDTQIASVHL